MLKNYEIRTISDRKLRKFCIAHDWYGLGSLQDFANMLQCAQECDGSTQAVIDLAWDIIDHTDGEHWNNSDWSAESILEHVAYVIINYCSTTTLCYNM